MIEKKNNNFLLEMVCLAVFYTTMQLHSSTVTQTTHVPLLHLWQRAEIRNKDEYYYIV